MERGWTPDFSAAKGRRLLIALSGGADSVALTCMLAQERARLNLTLFAAHVEHGIRGEESRADRDFCRELCRSLDIPLRIAELDVPRLSRERREGLETAARRHRYEVLERFRAEQNADWIVLAHHRDDQAETVLMHLLRGCGTEGVGGMSVQSGRLYRPLLDVPKAALEQWLRVRGIGWRVDSTNQSPCTPRNALRLHGLPVLEESYPGAKLALARYAETAQWENRLMERLTDDFLREHLESGPYGQRILRPEDADPAILRRAIRRLCGAELSHDQTLKIAALCDKARGRIDVSGTLTVERTPRAVYFLPPRAVLPAPAPLPISGSVVLEGVGRLRVSVCAPVPLRNAPLKQVLNRDALAGAVVRFRRDGDRIRPLGCGDKLLSDVLTDRKIDRPLRDFIPLVAVGSEVLWAVGICISDRAKIEPDTKDALLLEWLTE